MSNKYRVGQQLADMVQRHRQRADAAIDRDLQTHHEGFLAAGDPHGNLIGSPQSGRPS